MSLEALFVLAVVEACLAAYGLFRGAALVRVKDATREPSSCDAPVRQPVEDFAASR